MLNSTKDVTPIAFWQLGQISAVEEPVDIQAYNKEIDAAMARIDSGKFTTQENLEKEIAAW